MCRTFLSCHISTVQYDNGKKNILNAAGMCEWVRDAWQQLDSAIIRKAFLECGISNVLDGTEDDYLWHEPDSVQETSVYSDDPFDSDNEFYDDATNTCCFEEWTELFGEYYRILCTTILCNFTVYYYTVFKKTIMEFSFHTT